LRLHKGPALNRIGYLIPEFPGQTHTWMWREISHLRGWGAEIVIFSTRRPSQRDCSRHAFTNAAMAETTYLWPLGVVQTLFTLLWALVLHPIGFLRCFWLGLTLPVNRRPRWRHVLPLLLPACILAREVRRRGLKRIHSQTCSNSAILGMMVKRLLGTPFSLVLNANLEWWGGAMCEKFQDAEFTITHAQWLLDQIRRDYPTLRSDQAFLARVGVDTRKWVPVTRPGDRPPGPFRIVTVSRLHPGKGHDDLICAVGLLVAQGRDVTLQVIGDGPQRLELEEKARKANLTDRVVFHGSLSEDVIIERFSHAHAFVLASHAEPLGVVYMEAMAMELATIGTAVGGVGEIIQDGQNGLLVPPRDPHALAAAMERLLLDPDLRERLARAGRQTIVNRFDSRLGAAILFERFFGVAPPASPDDLETSNPAECKRAVDEFLTRHKELKLQIEQIPGDAVFLRKP
jgi:colanic acid/amylovoran biosynthesis glycosyltransferase